MNPATVTIIGGATRSREEILQRAGRLAAGLQSLGVGPGDAVGLIAHNDLVWFEAEMGVKQLDAYVVPINWRWQGEELAHVLHDSAPKVLLADATLVPNVLPVLPATTRLLVVPDIGALTGLPHDALPYENWLAGFDAIASTGSGLGSSMIYTSGTTGRPKAVRRLPAAEAEVVHRRKVLALVYNAAAENRALVTGPMYHLFPQATAMANFRAGGSVWVMRKFDPEECLRLIQEHHITHVQWVPTNFVRLLRLPREIRDRYDVSSLRHVIHSGAPCAADVKRAMLDWVGPIIWESYGSTETGVMTLISPQEWRQRPDSVGKPVLTGEVRIHDTDGRLLPAGEVGDIYLRMHGTPDFTYHGNHEARLRAERDGFITTGDMGCLDDEGYLYIRDRRSDMLISGGVNIYPVEIEAALLSHPEIVDAAVFGIPDTEFGESVAAHITTTEGSKLDEQGVRDYLRNCIAGYKIPKVVVFEKELPRQENGKIYKRLIREPYWQGHTKKI
jgi:long-chain acyl-CoA synthetase